MYQVVDFIGGHVVRHRQQLQHRAAGAFPFSLFPFPFSLYLYSTAAWRGRYR
jgi:hypothetical protein